MRTSVWLLTALLLATTTTAMAGPFGLFESAEKKKVSSLAEALIRKCESGVDGRALEFDCEMLSVRHKLLGETERQKLVAPLLSVLEDTARYDDGTHFDVIPLLGRLRQPEVIPTLLACLEREGRPLTRFQAGAALTRLGQARAGLPAVEEWARRGQRICTTCTRYRSPALGVCQLELDEVTLPERAEDSALNQYFVRVLSYPSQTLRIDAIQFLLGKDGTNKEAAFDAAIDILEHPRPERDAWFASDRKQVLGLLRKRGGPRGKALAEAYEKR